MARDYDRLSDPELVNIFLDGDRLAFISLFRRYQKTIYRYLLWRLGNSQEAEEETQWVFLRAYEKLSGQVMNVKAWLFAIARNRSIEIRRREARRKAKMSEFVANQLLAERTTPEDAYGEKERVERVLKGLGDTVEIIMTAMGYTAEERAVSRGTTVNYARKRLHKERKKAQDCLRKMDGEDNE